jgi:hypothetical protein
MSILRIDSNLDKEGALWLVLRVFKPSHEVVKHIEEALVAIAKTCNDEILDAYIDLGNSLLDALRSEPANNLIAEVVGLLVESKPSFDKLEECGTIQNLFLSDLSVELQDKFLDFKQACARAKENS